MPLDAHNRGLSGGTDGDEAWGSGYGRDTGADADHLYQFGMPDPTAYNQQAVALRGAANSQFNRMASGQDSYAASMMQQGQGAAARGMAQMAVGRGSNAAAQRNAILGGAQMSQQSSAQAAQMRGQEMQRARMARMEAGNQLRQGELWWNQLEQQQQQAAANHYAQMAGHAATERGQDMQIAGAAIGAGGTLLGGAMASGEDLKTAATLLSPAAQSRIADFVGSRRDIRFGDRAVYRHR